MDRSTFSFGIRIRMLRFCFDSHIQILLREVAQDEKRCTVPGVNKPGVHRGDLKAKASLELLDLCLD
jgi:hypothetical protein